MCRWLAYTGSPVLLTDVLYTPVHSLIDQSLHSKLGAETTNGDGFGVGWYDTTPAPGYSAASSRPGMTRTCMSWRGM
jgi:predicted glutamine amidotransferase